jgi:hypothetical protein
MAFCVKVKRKKALYDRFVYKSRTFDIYINNRNRIIILCILHELVLIRLIDQYDHATKTNSNIACV